MFSIYFKTYFSLMIVAFMAMVPTSVLAGSCSGTITGDENLKGREKTKQLAKSVGLKTQADQSLGYTRKKIGKNFVYYYPRGRSKREKQITEKAVLERIDAIKIPPAWTYVWVAPDANYYIQATGLDEKGRKQSLYHAKFTQATSEFKFNNTLRFGRTLPMIRKQALKDIQQEGLNKDKVIATVVLLLDETLIRVGTSFPDKDTMQADFEAFGLSTLKRSHIQIDAGEVTFNFIGKKGVHHHFAMEIENELVLEVLGQLKSVQRGRRGIAARLFKYVDSHGEFQAISAFQVNRYIANASGSGFTAKNFRTWHATVIAAVELSHFEVTDSLAQKKRNLNAAIKAVAEDLHNTPAVARSSYIHPAIIKAYLEEGFDFSTIFGGRGRPPANLTKDEKAVLDWLEQT